MQNSNDSLIKEIRVVSQILVSALGFMNRNLAGTKLSASAVHTIIELGKNNGLTSKELSSKLLLDKSTISRLIVGLLSKDEIYSKQSNDDCRKKLLYLTQKGKETLRQIDLYAHKQVSEAIHLLDEKSQQQVLNGLKKYSSALCKNLNSSSLSETQTNNIQIKTGYIPTITGRIVEMLHSHMNKHYGFGVKFELSIAKNIVEFFSRVDEPQSETWYAEINGDIVGSISIDGESISDEIAQLRWFVISKRIRGSGVGRTLLSEALKFCDEYGFKETHLWTFKGLNAARSLYESFGFNLSEELNSKQWGSIALEQKFVRKRPNTTPV